MMINCRKAARIFALRFPAPRTARGRGRMAWSTGKQSHALQRPPARDCCLTAGLITGPQLRKGTRTPPSYPEGGYKYLYFAGK